ncbi:MAG: cyclic nucleotide-binding domain-containing protein [Acidimicrobiales bacterium]
MRIRRDERVALLKGVDLLSGCSSAELSRIASLTTEWDAVAGQVLAKQGDVGKEFFIIVSGKAEASRNGVSLATLSPTSFFGELALLDGGERTATVVAQTDLRLLVLSRGEFKELCRSYPAVMNKMLVELGARLRKADEMLGGSRVRGPNQLLTV